MTTFVADASQRVMRIGLWGAPGSGKTTFLGVLQIATVSEAGDRPWMIHGVNDTASDFLSESTHRLRNERAFPVVTEGSTNLRWRLVRPVAGARPRYFWRKPVPPGQRVLELEIVDVAGGTFRSAPPVDDQQARSLSPDFDDLQVAFDEYEDADGWQQVLDHLAACDGIVYLFDPTDPNPYDHVQRTVEQLSRRAYETGRLRDGRLPHHLAVCIAKFDDPAVFAQARNAGLLLTSTVPGGPPCVANSDAKELFRRLCTEPAGRSRLLVHDSIEKYFAPSRVRHFVISAIGFHIGPTGRFLPNDFVNVMETAHGLRIRGEVRPINVLEPLHWLEQRPPAVQQVTGDTEGQQAAAS